MRHLRFLFVILVVAFYAAVSNAQSTPVATVQAFYKYDWSHSQIFNRRNLDSRKRWLSPSFYRLFLNELESVTDSLFNLWTSISRRTINPVALSIGLESRPFEETVQA